MTPRIIRVFLLLMSAVSVSMAAPASDTAFARVLNQAITDSLSRLRDSLQAQRDRDNAVDSLADDRPARTYLRASDPSLFAAASGSVGDDYPMGPGDGLVLTVWGQKQARYDLEVDRDGQVQIPSLGVVSLNGLNFGETRRLIGRKLSGIYSGISSGGTQYDLTISKLRQIRVFVVGDVRKPGGYMLTGATSVLQAVAIAGGPTELGSDRTVIIGDGPQARRVDLYQYLFLGRRPKGDVLRDGDIVRIPAAMGVAEVRGGAARPGRYEIVPGETALSLLELAGGFGPRGAEGTPINLIRRVAGGTTAALVGPGATALGGIEDSPVGAGDVLEVPVRVLGRRTSPVITGAVARPGTYGWVAGLKLGRLLELAGGTTNQAILERAVVYRNNGSRDGVVMRVALSGGEDLEIQAEDSVVVGSLLDTLTTPKQVRVSGAVRSPGEYRWSAGMTVKDLILLAGGFQPWADPSKTRIDAPTKGTSSSTSRIVAMDPRLVPSGSDPEIVAGGLVHVPSQPGGSSSVVRLEGYVVSPGHISLIGSRENVSAVVTRAGGLHPDAYGQGAQLHRASEGRIPFDLSKALKDPGSPDDVLLLQGDSLYVPHVPATVQVRGEVNQPTAVLWRKGKDWDWYVENAGGMTDSAMKSAVYIIYADGSIRTRDGGMPDPGPGAVVVVPRLEPPRRSTTAEKISAFGVIASAITSLVTAWAIYMTVDN